MSRPLLFVLLLTLALLQSTLFARYAPWGAAPTLVFVVLFFRCTRCSVQEALIWTFTFGLLLDILGMDALGIHALAMIPMVLAAQPLRVRPWAINPVSVMVLVAMSALFNNLFLSVARGGVGFFDVLIQTTMQLLFVPIIYFIYRRIYKR